MPVKSMDVIVKTPFAPHKPNSDLIALGYKFLCAHISIERFVEADIELDTDSWEVVAVEQTEGFNFYAKTNN